MSDIRRMPVIFIGHGNPMNALRDTPFTRKLVELGRELPRPRAILCVSAHWMSEGSWLTHMREPRTIHDFYGFPKELFELRYPAPGSPETAERIQAETTEPKLQLDDEMWGIDHGAWSVLRHLFPAADIPVIQLSLYLEQPPEYHYHLGKSLKPLRSEGILILASGNIVHNLRWLNWEENAKPYDWAVDFDEWIKGRLIERDYRAIMRDYGGTAAGSLSVPTPDHYYPLLYALGASDSHDELHFEYEGIENGSISMRSLSFGRSRSARGAA